jgi:hypothetical protein
MGGFNPGRNAVDSPCEPAGADRISTGPVAILAPDGRVCDPPGPAALKTPPIKATYSGEIFRLPWAAVMGVVALGALCLLVAGAVYEDAETLP